MKQELFNGLNEEQIAKAKACKNQDELFALAKKEGIELNDEQLSAISGGGCFSSRKCPDCGSKEYEKIHARDGNGSVGDLDYYVCKKCGRKWA